MVMPKRRVHRFFVIALIVYLSILLIFTLYPRPLLESADPRAIRDFLESHANLFYKILYADTSLVYIGNYLMLFPLALLISWSYPNWPIWVRLSSGVGLSGVIEMVQMAIPGRVSDVMDFASNSIGFIAGIVLAEILCPGARLRVTSE